VPPSNPSHTTGTLGIHKQSQFTDATVCLFIFDILYLNGVSLMKKPMEERRKILEDNVTVIRGRIELTESITITKVAELKSLFKKVKNEGLEGLVLKDLKGIYKPNMRHWIKLKKVCVPHYLHTYNYYV